MSGLRGAYAEAFGVSQRTAQRHSKPGDPNHDQWLKFIGEKAAEGVARKKIGDDMAPDEARALTAMSPLGPTEDVPEFYQVPDADLHPVQVQEKQAWQVHASMFEMWSQNVASPGSGAVALVIAKELPKLREDFQKALRAREEWEMSQRIKIKKSEVEEFVAQFVFPLAELMRSLKSDLPPLLNPENPQFARERFLEFERDKLAKSVSNMLRGSEEFLAG